MSANTHSRLSLLAVMAGIVVIICGSFISFAMRNPGGPPVPARDAQAAKQLAYLSFGFGAAIAIGIPALQAIWSKLMQLQAKELSNKDRK